eukprot:10883610-Alexandrium_andersonii.AAC.1
MLWTLRVDPPVPPEQFPVVLSSPPESVSCGARARAGGGSRGGGRWPPRRGPRETAQSRWNIVGAAAN